MRTIEYQQQAINELSEKTIKMLNLGQKRKKIVFKAPTGSGKTIMTCMALANIVDGLKSHSGNICTECAFIWFAPRQLHLQSYGSIAKYFSETRKLEAVMFDDLDKSEGIKPGQILFLNWESVNKDKNLFVRESESGPSLYEITRITQDDNSLPIVAIIDEEHMYWSKTADKSGAVLDRINPAVELRISATPKTKADYTVTVERKEVIEAEMIKKEIVLNPDIQANFSDERELNYTLVKSAIEKRQQIAGAYRELGVNINPLLLIQLPNDTSEKMTSDDEKIAESVKTMLEAVYDITEQNGKLAVWLSAEKKNLDNLAQPTNMAEVLLFKEAIALGWDCPRAAVLLIFRKLESSEFTVQTVGRILRMPEQKHYTNSILNTGYVYTDIAKDKISIVAADASYIIKDSVKAYRRQDLTNVTLKACYAERPNADRNYLGSNFKRILYNEALKFWKGVDNMSMLFSAEDMRQVLKIKDNDERVDLPETDDERVNENRRQMEEMKQNRIRLDVANVNIEIPQDVHFQNDEADIEVGKVKYARKANEVKRVFLAWVDTKGHMFEAKGRTDKISTYLLSLMEELFAIDESWARKVILYHENQPKFDRLLDRAFDAYLKHRNIERQKKGKRIFKDYDWQVPAERTYDSETNEVKDAHNHAMEPFVELKKSSSQEKAFIEFLEANTQYIDWWYKNGDKGKQHYAIGYQSGDSGTDSLFYVDFVIRMKNGNIYLFDTKSAGSDAFAHCKHNALIEYAKANTTDTQKIYGGIIINQGTNWLYSKLPIENTTDLTNWDSFYPENA